MKKPQIETKFISDYQLSQLPREQDIKIGDTYEGKKVIAFERSIEHNGYWLYCKDVA